VETSSYNISVKNVATTQLIGFVRDRQNGTAELHRQTDKQTGGKTGGHQHTCTFLTAN